jgi:hypothetical protein
MTKSNALKELKDFLIFLKDKNKLLDNIKINDLFIDLNY